MKKVFFTLAALAASAVLSQAGTIVQWGEPDPFTTAIVTGNKGFTTPSTFVANTARNPAGAGTGLYYPSSSMRSPIFNSAASKLLDNGPDNTSQVQNNTVYDRIRYIALSTTALQTMTVWENTLAPFLTAETTVESFTLGGFSSGNNPAVYFLFQKSTGSMDWFATLGSSNFGATTITISNAGAASWSSFTPITAGVGTIGAVSAIDMTNVKSVGFYSVHSDTDVNATLGLQVGDFRVTAVPEPSTFALLGLGALGIGLLRRRRK